MKEKIDASIVIILRFLAEEVFFLPKNFTQLSISSPSIAGKTNGFLKLILVDRLISFFRCATLVLPGINAAADLGP